MMIGYYAAGDLGKNVLREMYADRLMDLLDLLPACLEKKVYIHI